jgi:hypothetical protein
MLKKPRFERINLTRRQIPRTLYVTNECTKGQTEPITKANGEDASEEKRTGRSEGML